MITTLDIALLLLASLGASVVVVCLISLVVWAVRLVVDRKRSRFSRNGGALPTARTREDRKRARNLGLKGGIR